MTIVTSPGTQVIDVAIDHSNNKLFWTDYTGVGPIKQANLDGTGVTDLIGSNSGISFPYGINVDTSGGYGTIRIRPN